MAGSVDITRLKQYKEANDKEKFNEVLNAFLPEIRKLVFYKLRYWEGKGIIPKNRYSADEVVDEVYLRMFGEFPRYSADEKTLKVKMLAAAREILDDIKKRHSAKNVPVEEILAEELKELEEEYTVDAEGEKVLMEELDDVSYSPGSQEYVYLLEDANFDELAENLELEGKEKFTEEVKRMINKAYTALPDLTRSVYDHYVFAGLSVSQIAEVHKINVKDVNRIIENVKRKLSGLVK